MNNNQNVNKSSFLTPSQKAGNYILAVCAIVLAIIIALNLVCAVLPDAATVFDTSSMKMLTLSDSSKKFLRSVNEDINIYYLCENSEEDIRIGAFLDKVEAQNDRINVKVVDPILSPDFASGYTDDLLSNGSIIVASEKRSRAIDFDDLYYYYNEYFGQMSYDDYDYYQKTYYAESADMYYLLVNSTSEYFNADSVITSAIEYVSADYIPTAYLLTSHGEREMSENLLYYMKSYDIEYGTIDSTPGEIPDNATCLIFIGPTSDISADEKSLIKGFLDKGGNLFVATDPANVDSLPNLLSLLGTYGVSTTSGVVFEEGDTQEIYAQVNATHNATAELAELNIQMYLPKASGIKVRQSDIPEGVNVTKIFTTSDSAHYEGSDDTQTFALGVAISDQSAEEESKVIWVSSADAFSDEAAFRENVNGGNYFYYLYSMRWMCDTFESSLEHVDGINIDETFLDVSQMTAIIWMIALVALIPIAIVVAGIVYLSVRRRR